MSTGWVLVVVVAALVALAIGWLVWRGRIGGETAAGPPTDHGSGSEARTDTADGEAVGPGDYAADRHTVRELKRALRFEQSLLDGVAAANGVPPRDFRRVLARDYLHVADPYRWKHLADPVEVDEINERDDSEFPAGDVESLRAQVVAKQRELDHTRTAIAELRRRVESLVEARRRALPAAPIEVIDLREEVAELRSQMADRAIEADRLRVEVNRRTGSDNNNSNNRSTSQASLDAEQIDDILLQLSGLQDRVLRLRPVDSVDSVN